MTQLTPTPTELTKLLTLTQSVMYQSPDTLGQKYYIRFTLDTYGSVLNETTSRVFNWSINESSQVVLDNTENIDIQVWQGPFVYTVANTTRRLQSQYKFVFPSGTSLGDKERIYYSQSTVAPKN